MDIKKMFLITIIVIIVSIMGFGAIWSHNFANGTFTFVIDMNKETRDYLVEHNYCVFVENQPFDSDKPSYTFLGDCEYLDTTLFKPREVSGNCSHN